MAQDSMALSWHADDLLQPVVQTRHCWGRTYNVLCTCVLVLLCLLGGNNECIHLSMKPVERNPLSFLPLDLYLCHIIHNWTITWIVGQLLVPKIIHTISGGYFQMVKKSSQLELCFKTVCSILQLWLGMDLPSYKKSGDGCWSSLVTPPSARLKWYSYS